MIKTKEDMENYLNGKTFHASRFIRFSDMLNRTDRIIKELSGKRSSGLFAELSGKPALTDENKKLLTKELKVVITGTITWVKKVFKIDEEVSMDYELDISNSHIHVHLPHWMDALRKAIVTFSKSTPDEDPEFTTDEQSTDFNEEIVQETINGLKNEIDEDHIKDIMYGI